MMVTCDIKWFCPQDDDDYDNDDDDEDDDDDDDGDDYDDDDDDDDDDGHQWYKMYVSGVPVTVEQLPSASSKLLLLAKHRVENFLL